jgi:deoxyribodipyrimidine photo-lyase
MKFATTLKEIDLIIDKIDPVKYGKTRNYTNGDVTYLSVYISRGIISTKYVLNKVIQKGYGLHEIEQFVKELCWRDYFQRVWQHKNINLDIKEDQQKVTHHLIPENVINANTSINAIDEAINKLYETGYLHNHYRMYISSITANIAQSHWYLPAKWMYYHLLDGDWASNACSWQWVGGSNSSKKYYVNQENISKYTNTNLQNSIVNVSYETLPEMAIPKQLKDTITFDLTTELPFTKMENFKDDLPVLLYNYYNLDLNWRLDLNANRVLLLDPSIFEQYPISKKCVGYMLDVFSGIENGLIFVGSFSQFTKEYKTTNIYYKEHPLNEYQGTEEPRDWIINDVTSYYPSFFGYWKRVEPFIKKLF